MTIRSSPSQAGLCSSASDIAGRCWKEVTSRQNALDMTGTTTSIGGTKAMYASDAPATHSQALRRRMKRVIEEKLCSGRSSSAMVVACCMDFSKG